MKTKLQSTQTLIRQTTLSQLNSIEESKDSVLCDMDGDQFYWDPANSSKEVNLSGDWRHAFLLESNYLFRTILANRPFMDGHHYWEIVADARTEHELKVGVTL